MATTFTETAATTFVPGLTGLAEHTVTYAGDDRTHTLYASALASAFLAEVGRLAQEAGPRGEVTASADLQARVRVDHTLHDDGAVDVAADVQVFGTDVAVTDLAGWVEQVLATWDPAVVLPQGSRLTASAVA